jgi:hypothetical protein
MHRWAGGFPDTRGSAGAGARRKHRRGVEIFLGRVFLKAFAAPAPR